MTEKSPLDQAIDLLVYAPVGLALTARENLSEMVDKGREKVANEVSLARMIGQFAVQKGGYEARKLAEKAQAVLTGGGQPAGPAPATSSSGAAGEGPAAGGGTATTPTAPAGEAGEGPAPSTSVTPATSADRASAAAAASAAAMTAPPAPAGAGPADGPTGAGGGPPAAAPPVPEEPPGAPPAVPDAAAPALGHRRPEAAAASGAHLAIPGYDALSASQVVQRLAGLTPEELEAVEAYERSTRGRRTILNRAAQLRPDASS